MNIPGDPLIDRSCKEDPGSSACEEGARTSSYREIFKSSSIVGGANALVIVIRMVSAKAVALLIGPVGYGLVGLLQSTIEFVGTGTRFGLLNAIVREIATASGSGDEEALGRTIQAVRLAMLGSGALGAACMVLFARKISMLTFGSEEHATAIAVLSSVVLLKTLAQGRFSIMQGLRRIQDLALAKVLGSVFGAVAAITLLAVYGLRGVVPLIVAGAICSFLVSWWFLRRAAIPKSRLSFRTFLRTIRPLMALGFMFLLAGLATNGMGYTARVMVGRRFGTEGVGFYSAAWGISGMFVGFVLQAMGTDFYPRLCAVADDAREMRRLVNEQTTIGVLMALPGILFFLSLAPLLIRLFYSAKFLPATNLLIFMMLGMAVRVVAWPLGYIKIAKMRNGIFLATEVGFVIGYLLALWFLLPAIGIVAAGVGWLIAYVLFLAANYIIGRRLIAFRWSRESRLTMGTGALSVVLTLSGVWLLPRGVGAAAGIAVAIIVSLIFKRQLERLLGVRIFTVVRKRLFGQ